MGKDIIIDGIKIHYDVSGPDGGSPVVLMHGWGCNHTTVKSIADILQRHMKVYSIDLPGHGKSDEPDSIWGVENFTRAIEKFIELNKITKPSLIGHSFGGRIAILLASRHATGKVVLVDSAGIKPKRSASYYWKVYSFKLIKKVVLALYGKKKGEEIMDRYRSRKGSADYRNSSPVMRAVMSKCVNEDLKHVMPSIKAPVLLVWGEDDTATPLSDAKTMEKLIPDAGLVSFAQCGHYSFLDNPFGFKAVISEFFKKEMAG